MGGNGVGLRLEYGIHHQEEAQQHGVRTTKQLPFDGGHARQMMHDLWKEIRRTLLLVLVLISYTRIFRRARPRTRCKKQSGKPSR